MNPTEIARLSSIFAPTASSIRNSGDRMVELLGAQARERSAAGLYDRLVARVKAFQERLTESEEVGACLAYFGREVSINIHSIGFENPDLIVLTGRDFEGREVELIQHMSQVAILLIPVQVKVGRAHRIGFASNSEPAPTP